MAIGSYFGKSLEESNKLFAVTSAPSRGMDINHNNLNVDEQDSSSEGIIHSPGLKYHHDIDVQLNPGKYLSGSNFYISHRDRHRDTSNSIAIGGEEGEEFGE